MELIHLRHYVEEPGVKSCIFGGLPNCQFPLTIAVNPTNLYNVEAEDSVFEVRESEWKKRHPMAPKMQPCDCVISCETFLQDGFGFRE